MAWCSAARNARGVPWNHGASASGCLSTCCPPAVWLSVWRSSGWQAIQGPLAVALAQTALVGPGRDEMITAIHVHAGLMRVRYDHRLSALPLCRPHGHRLCIHQHHHRFLSLSSSTTKTPPKKTLPATATPLPAYFALTCLAPLAPLSILDASPFTHLRAKHRRPGSGPRPSRPLHVCRNSLLINSGGWLVGQNNVVPSVPRCRSPALFVSVSDSELRRLTDYHGLPQASRTAGHVSAKPHMHRRHALLWHVGYAPPLNDLSQVTSNSRLPSPAGFPSC